MKSRFIPMAAVSSTEQIYYNKALEGEGGETVKELTWLTIELRIQAEQELANNKTLKPGDKNWKLSGKNFAALKFKFKNSEGREITVQPRAYSSEYNDGETTQHSERYALGHSINEAIKQGWKPKDSKGGPLKGFKSIPPSPEELRQY